MPFPGFIYWGLLAVCLAVIVAYSLWMGWANRRDRERAEHDPSTRERGAS